MNRINDAGMAIKPKKKIEIITPCKYCDYYCKKAIDRVIDISFKEMRIEGEPGAWLDFPENAIIRKLVGKFKKEFGVKDE